MIITVTEIMTIMIMIMTIMITKVRKMYLLLLDQDRVHASVHLELIVMER